MCVEQMENRLQIQVSFSMHTTFFPPLHSYPEWHEFLTFGEGEEKMGWTEMNESGRKKWKIKMESRGKHWLIRVVSNSYCTWVRHLTSLNREAF